MAGPSQVKPKCPDPRDPHQPWNEPFPKSNQNVPTHEARINRGMGLFLSASDAASRLWTLANMIQGGDASAVARAAEKRKNVSQQKKKRSTTRERERERASVPRLQFTRQWVGWQTKCTSNNSNIFSFVKRMTFYNSSSSLITFYIQENKFMPVVPSAFPQPAVAAFQADAAFFISSLMAAASWS